MADLKEVVKDMADEQTKAGWGDVKKTLAAVIITGVFSAIVFTPSGYYINEYLTKDNIRIEQVDFIPETNYFSLSRKDYDELRDNTNFHQFIRDNYHISDLLRNSVYEESFPDSTRFSKSRKGLDKKEVDVLIESIDKFIKWKTEKVDLFKRYITRLEEYKDGDYIADIVWYLNDYNILGIYAKNSSDSIPVLIDRYNHYIKFSSSEDIIISKIIDEMRNFKQNRTGWMDISVAFLNLGNTDGLVSRHGTLYINDEIKIKIQTADRYAILKVEKRSMLQVTFELNKNETIPRDVELLRRILTDNLSSKASVEVYDIRGKPIRSKNFSIFLLPNT